MSGWKDAWDDGQTCLILTTTVVKLGNTLQDKHAMYVETSADGLRASIRSVSPPQHGTNGHHAILGGVLATIQSIALLLCSVCIL